MYYPKAFIYELDNANAIVCKYSVELFNSVLTRSRLEGNAYMKDGGAVSHRVVNRSTCNCKEIVSEICAEVDGRFKLFDKTIITIELLELECATSHLLICEVCKTRNVSNCKIKVVNTTIKRKTELIKDNKNKNCLLQLHAIFSDCFSTFYDPICRNKSLNTRNKITKDCVKVVSFEMAAKGALPGHIAQICRNTRGRNTGWFDYGRIMDVCIQYKLSPKNIADLIKEIASIDPMHPDPIIFIKGRMRITDRNVKRTRLSIDTNDQMSRSQGSSDMCNSSVAFTEDLNIYETNSTSKIKVGKPKGSRTYNKWSRTSQSSKMNKTKETQTSYCIQSDTLTDFYQRTGYGGKTQRRLSHEQAYDDSISKYLRTPEDCEEHDYLDEEEYQYYSPHNTYRGFKSSSKNLGRLEPHCSDSFNHDSLKEPLNFRDGDNINHEYLDFLILKKHIEKEESGSLNCGTDVEEWNLVGLRNKMDTSSFRLQPLLKFHMKKKPNDFVTTKNEKGSYMLRSASQPILRNNEFNLQSAEKSEENCSKTNQTNGKMKDLSKTTVNSSTQTLDYNDSVSVTDQRGLYIQKCESEGDICHNYGLNRNESNSTRDRLHTSHVGVNTSVSLNTSKIFLIKAVQTEFDGYHKRDGCNDQVQRFISLIPQFIPSGQMEDNNYADNDRCIKRSFTNQGESFVSERKTCGRPIYREMGFSLNRNDNNHTNSISPSSRNSQIVEVDNENMDKISSVIVDQESHPIIYHLDKYQDSKDHIDQNPFYERGKMCSDLGNMNFNNSIRSVTVSNKNPPSINQNQCQTTGCQNTDVRINNTYDKHLLPSSQCCSPERCLSRLSCLVTLNRQLLERNMSPEQSVSHRTALRRVIYGPYDEDNCTDNIREIFEPAKLRDDCLQDDSQNLLSLTNPNRKFSRNTTSELNNEEQRMLSTINHPLHSSMKLFNGNFVECYPLNPQSPSQRFISDLSKVNNPAQIVYEPEPTELVTPIQTLPISECQNAIITRSLADSNFASCLKVPLSNIGISTSNPSYVYNPDTLPQLVVSNDIQHSDAINLPTEYMAAANEQSCCKNSQIPSYRIKNSCNLSFPLNLQICPVTGCRNITTTGQPPCMQLKSLDNSQCYLDNVTYNPCSTSNLKSDHSKVSNRSPPPLSQSIKRFNHSQVHNPDLSESTFRSVNDSKQTLNNPNEFSIHSMRSPGLLERSIIINGRGSRDPTLAAYDLTKQSSNVDFLPRLTEVSELSSNHSQLSKQFKKGGSIIKIYNDEVNANTSQEDNISKVVSVKSQIVYVFPNNSDIDNAPPDQPFVRLPSNKLQESVKTLSSNTTAVAARVSTRPSNVASIKVEFINSSSNQDELLTLTNSDIFPKIRPVSTVNSPSLTPAEQNQLFIEDANAKVEDASNYSLVNEEQSPLLLEDSAAQANKSFKLEEASKNPSLIKVVQSPLLLEEYDTQAKKSSKLKEASKNPSLIKAKPSPLLLEDSDAQAKKSSKLKEGSKNPSLIKAVQSPLLLEEYDTQAKKSSKLEEGYKNPSLIKAKPSPLLLEDSNAQAKKSSKLKEVSKNPSLIKAEQSPLLLEDFDAQAKKSSKVERKANDSSLIKTEESPLLSSKLLNSKTDLMRREITSQKEPLPYSESKLIKNKQYLSNIKNTPIRNVSSSSRQTIDSMKACMGNMDIYETVVNLPASAKNNSSSRRQTMDNRNSCIVSILTSDINMSDKSNNSAKRNGWMNNSSSSNLDLDYLYLDSQTMKVRSRIFSHSILFKDPDCLLLGQCNNMFYSTPELILNIQLNQILVSERWDIQSDMVLENIDHMTISLPAFIDHPNNKMFLLISLSVYFLFCAPLPILVHTALLPNIDRKGKISRLLKSIRPTKIAQKNELIKDFKNKIVTIIQKCRNTKQLCQKRNCHISTFSMNCAELPNNMNPTKSRLDEYGCAASPSADDQSEYSLYTRSCMDFQRPLSEDWTDHKRWKSEPTLEIFERLKMHSTGTLQRQISSTTKLSTSDLSFLCVEVLRKMDRCILNSGGKEDFLPTRLCKSSTFKDNKSHHCSSKDTLKLIVKALKFLHRSQLDNSGPSNKTLDSVSSIKTCSGDRLESMTSLTRKIIRPKCDYNIVMSAYNKAL